MSNLKSIGIIFIISAFFGLGSVSGQEKKQNKKDNKHQIVFEVNVGGKEAWQGVLNNVENLQRAFGEGKTDIEVVLHGKGLGMIMKTNTSQAERLRVLSGKGVIFAACENTMKRMNITREQLFPFAVTVDSGVAEVVRKQEAGWSYIKAGS